MINLSYDDYIYNVSLIVQQVKIWHLFLPIQIEHIYDWIGWERGAGGERTARCCLIYSSMNWKGQRQSVHIRWWWRLSRQKITDQRWRWTQGEKALLIVLVHIDSLVTRTTTRVNESTDVTNLIDHCIDQSNPHLASDLNINAWWVRSAQWINHWSPWLMAWEGGLSVVFV